MTQTEVFADALRARGYPLAVIVQQLSRVSYDQRCAYLGLVSSDTFRRAPRQHVVSPLSSPSAPRCSPFRLDNTSGAASATLVFNTSPLWLRGAMAPTSKDA